MYWHYQVVQKRCGDDRELFEVYEKYVDDDSPGRVYELTETPVFPSGSSLDELREDLIQMLLDLERFGVLDRSNVVDLPVRFRRATVP